MQVKPVRRATGRSATAAAAYRSGCEIPDKRTGEQFDYTRKQGIEHSEIVLPAYAARHDINWARDRTALWNAAELAEKRKDSRVAREYEVALPAELSAEQQLELAREFSQYIADRHGCAVDIAIHAPHRNGDQRNHHAHLLATTRRITPTGLGDKTNVELSDTDRKKRGLGPAATEIMAVRERWAQMSNEALARHGHKERIDHRSLAAQREDALQRGDEERAAELDREPTKHLGVAATAMERKGQWTDLGDINRRIAEAAEAGRLQRESQKLDQSILDLSADLAAALKERDSARERQRSLQPDGELAMDVRRQAREAWTQLRAAGKEARQQVELWKDGFPNGGLAKDAPGRSKDGTSKTPGAPAGQGRGTGALQGNRSLLDKLSRFGQVPTDPKELERLLREFQEHELRGQSEQDPAKGRGGHDRRHPHPPHHSHDPGDPQTQQQRDRENEHPPHRDRGLDR